MQTLKRFGRDFLETLLSKFLFFLPSSIFFILKFMSNDYICIYNKYSFMVDIKKILEEEGPIRKYEGIAPDGFILISEQALEQLKIFDVWKEWKNDAITIKELNNNNFPEI